MNDESAPSSALGSPVLAKIRTEVPEFEESFQRELVAEGPEMGAFQGMSAFAEWLAPRLNVSGDHVVERAFRVVEELTSTDLPMSRPLVTEFVEALSDNPRAVALMGPETLRRG